MVSTNKVKYNHIAWGRTCSIASTGVHFLVIITGKIYLVWFGGSTELIVYDMIGTTKGSGVSCTVDNATFKRSGSTITVTTTSDQSIWILTPG